MPSLEIEGKSIEEAVEAACNQLKVSREKLEIEVLNSGSTGIFGIMGSKKARIRATVKEEEVEIIPEAETTLHAEPDSMPVTSSEIDMVDEARILTQDLLKLMGLDATVQVEQEKETLQIKIEGDTSGLLIGRRGQNLDALQYLITRILNRKGPDKIKVILDSGDYRSRRKIYLEEVALKMAAKAKQTGKPVVISPLNAHDRRIVHLTLEKDKSLKTISRGEGHLKKMVIFSTKKDQSEDPPPESET
ncbi:MAG: Jag N-terminal domain-containing protein [Deltaproteobacteria bacterium]|nr:Jag N-terminal domain-containing protein [Deltaproteobacteria bacterium]